MVTNWLVKFTDGSTAVVPAETIQDSFNIAEFENEGKRARSASFHSSYDEHQMPKWNASEAFGFGWGPVN
jgi:hypothetical protein